MPTLLRWSTLFSVLRLKPNKLFIRDVAVATLALLVVYLFFLPLFTVILSDFDWFGFEHLLPPDFVLRHPLTSGVLIDLVGLMPFVVLGVMIAFCNALFRKLETKR